MSLSTPVEVGTIVGLWRYPVKSMMGDELNATDVTEHGLLGDRAYAIVDHSDGKIASAKNPRKWPGLFDFRATFVDPLGIGARLPPVRVTLPDGTLVTSAQADVNQVLSSALSRRVRLAAADRATQERVPSSRHEASTAKAEEYWPDIEGLEHRDTVTDFELPKGTFFDCAVVHLLTTATLDRLRELYPQGRFEVRRFRPNIVVDTGISVKDFVENAWVGHTLAIGETVRLGIAGPCPRCVMTTLPQGDLPKDPGILRTAARYNQVSVGVYASVLRSGRIVRGDSVRLEPAA